MLALSVVDVRDYIFIAFFGAGSILVLFALIASYLIFRKLRSVLDGVKDNLESTKTTLNNAAATSTLVTEAVTKPVIKTASIFAGAKQAILFTLRLAKRAGGG
ncbi:MAG: hypothetical protein ACE5KI_06575 [Dehalococcoidia bacterium]